MKFNNNLKQFNVNGYNALLGIELLFLTVFCVNLTEGPNR